MYTLNNRVLKYQISHPTTKKVTCDMNFDFDCRCHNLQMTLKRNSCGMYKLNNSVLKYQISHPTIKKVICDMNFDCRCLYLQKQGV